MTTNSAPNVSSLGPVAAGLGSWQSARHGVGHFVVVKATFGLAPGVCTLENSPAPLVERELWSEGRSFQAPCELTPPKPRVDLVLMGSAYSARPVHRLVTYLCFGAFEKAVEVCSDRWVDLEQTVQQGAAFTRMPISWERAAGGPHTHNPVGRRAERSSSGKLHLPNVQPLATEPSAPDWTVEPTGFGPIAAAWPLRKTLLGRNPEPQFHGGQQPGLADDFNFAFFQIAPRDQQLDVVDLEAPLFLEGLHPAYPKLSTRLPRVVPHAVMEPSAAPLNLRLDTILIDTDRQQVSVIWRAGFWAREHQVQRVLVTLEADAPSAASGLSEETARLEIPLGANVTALPFGGQLGGAVNLRGAPGDTSGTPFAAAVARPPQYVEPPRPDESTQEFGQAGAEAPATQRVEALAPPVRASVTAAPITNRPPVPALPMRPATTIGQPAPVAAAPAPLASSPPPALASTPSVMPHLPPLPPLSQLPLASPLSATLPHSAPAPVAPPAAPALIPPAPSLQPPPARPSAVPAAPLPLPSQPALSGLNSALSAVPPLRPSAVPPPPPAPVLGAVLQPSASATSLPTMGAAAVGGRDSLPTFMRDRAQEAPARVQLGHAAEAASGGALKASQAAAEAQPEPAKREAVKREPEPEERQASEFLTLLWAHGDAPTLMPRREKRSDEEWVQRKGEARPVGGESDRAKVARALARATPHDAAGLKKTITSSATSDGVVDDVIAACRGVLTLAFDPFALLEVTLALAEPHAAVDRRLKETVDAAASLKEAHKAVPMNMIENAVHRVRAAFVGASSRQVPPDFLQANAERWLAEERKYLKRMSRGESCLIGSLAPSTGGAPIPIQLPDGAADFLPPLASFDAKMYGRATLQLEGGHPAQLWVLALATVAS